MAGLDERILWERLLQVLNYGSNWHWVGTGWRQRVQIKRLKKVNESSSEEDVSFEDGCKLLNSN